MNNVIAAQNRWQGLIANTSEIRIIVASFMSKHISRDDEGRIRSHRSSSSRRPVSNVLSVGAEKPLDSIEAMT